MVLSAYWAFVVHTAFEWLAIAVGVQIYRRTVARAGHIPTASCRERLIILLGAVVGAAIGSRIAFAVYDPELVSGHGGWALLSGGQSIVGGLLGGLIGVELAKGMIGVRASTGDAFVVPVLVALIIGRIGCFLAGLSDRTYGSETTLPWGYDFGDGVRRHPTQIYDQLFALTMLFALRAIGPRLSAVPGLQFKLMLSAYLIWRLFIDFLKPKPFVYLRCLSGIQLLCLLALCLYLPIVYRSAKAVISSRVAGMVAN
jgi:prolipoprotein diacylglyceryltransferase